MMGLEPTTFCMTRARPEPTKPTRAANPRSRAGSLTRSSARSDTNRRGKLTKT
jgi:hypothetical protein